VQVLNNPRNCKKWYPYTPGFSPQEHWEEVRMHELELKRQQFEKQMAADHKAVLMEFDRRNRIFSWVIGVFAAAEVFAAFAQMAFPNGWPWLMKIFGSAPPPASTLNIPGGF
jgi:hypothetical protein